MDKKFIFTMIIAVIFIAVIIGYNDKMTFNEITLSFVGAGGYLGFVWKWISEDTVKKNFKEQVGIKFSTFIDKKNESSKNV